MHAKLSIADSALLKNISLCRKVIIAYRKWLVKWLFTRIGYFELRICELCRKYVWFLNPFKNIKYFELNRRRVVARAHEQI